jgi:hypothetical protein
MRRLTPMFYDFTLGIRHNNSWGRFGPSTFASGSLSSGCGLGETLPSRRRAAPGVGGHPDDGPGGGLLYISCDPEIFLPQKSRGLG